MTSSEQPTCNIRITSPSPQLVQPLSFTFPLSTTIRELKGKITEALESRPVGDQQRLIYRGKILNDESSIGTVLEASANGEIINSEPSGFYTFHLALRENPTTPSFISLPDSTLLPPSSDFTAYSTAAQASNLSQTPHLRQIGRIVPSETIIREQLVRMRAAAQARVANFPPTQTVVGTVRSSSPSLGPTSTTTTSGSISGANLNVPTVGQAQQTSTGGDTLLSLLPQPSINAPSTDMIQPSTAERPLYLLQGPDGYLALLVPPDTSQSFNTSAPVNHPTYAPQGTHNNTGNYAFLNPDNFGMGAYYAHPVPQQPTPNAFPQNQNAHGAAAAQNQAQAHQAIAQRPQLTPAELIQRLRERAGHLWLAMRLVIFVVLFSGGGGMRRTITLGGLAFVIFIWQTGILSTQWANARALYNELFPARPARHTHINNLPPATQARILAQQRTTNAPLDPAITAQILINRDNERRSTRFREIYDGVERGLTIFLASLVPGMHERHVRAHEERERERERLLAAVQAAQAGVGAGVGVAGGQAQVPPGGQDAVGIGGNEEQAQQEQQADRGAMNNLAAEMLMGGVGGGIF